MILTGRSLCLPSRATIQELFSVARDTSIIPDISLDPVLSTYLSLDSSAALQHQYAFLQRSLSKEQLTAFNRNLTGELGGSRVTHGGVGVIALALSMLFDQIAQHVRGQGSTQGGPSPQRFQTNKIFGISSSSRIGWLIQNYLGLIPGIANDTEKMAVTTELYDYLLKLELLDHYERMTTKKRMSSVSMLQWLTGAVIHLHMRIHQARLHSVPMGSAESLRLSYKSGLTNLVQGYTTYLRRNIQETGAPGPWKLKTSTGRGPNPTAANIPSITNVTCSSRNVFNISQVRVNETCAPNSTAGISRNYKTDDSHVAFPVLKRDDESTGGLVTPNVTAGYSSDEEDSMLGLLVIEPGRNVSHNVQHHPCQSPAIQQALVSRIMNAQDLERNRNFFLFPEKVFHSLLRQRQDFQLKTS